MSGSVGFLEQGPGDPLHRVPGREAEMLLHPAELGDQGVAEDLEYRGGGSPSRKSRGFQEGVGGGCQVVSSDLGEVPFGCGSAGASVNLSALSNSGFRTEHQDSSVGPPQASGTDSGSYGQGRPPGFVRDGSASCLERSDRDDELRGSGAL